MHDRDMDTDSNTEHAGELVTNLLQPDISSSVHKWP